MTKLIEETIHKAIDCQSEFAKKSFFVFETQLSNFVGMVQALQFTIDHKELFQKTTSECTHCLKAIEEMQEVIGKMILEANKHKEEHLHTHDHPHQQEEKLPN